jgi:hypothetical protein
MVFTDLNPVFLARLRERLGEAATVVDDIEATQLAGPYPHAAVTLVLEHVRLATRPRQLPAMGEPPRADGDPGVPGRCGQRRHARRTVPGTMNVFRESARPQLVPLAELTAAMADLGYRTRTGRSRAGQ